MSAILYFASELESLDGANDKINLPSSSYPVTVSTSVGEDGLVTVSATFLVSEEETNALPIGFPIDPLLFSGTRTLDLQGSLFVQARSLEKKNGLNYLVISAASALNPPVIIMSTNVSPRSHSFTFPFQRNDEQLSTTFLFDYLAETNTSSAVFTGDNEIKLEVPEPKLIETYNERTTGDTFTTIDGNLDIVKFSATPRILTSRTVQKSANITRVTMTAQFVFE